VNRDQNAMAARATFEAIAGSLDVQALEVLAHLAGRLADSPPPPATATARERFRLAVQAARSALAVFA
jgi:hypothetical protein